MRRSLLIALILFFLFSLIPQHAVQAKGGNLYPLGDYGWFTEDDADEAFFNVSESSVAAIVGISDVYLSGTFDVTYRGHRFTMSISGANSKTHYLPNKSGNVIGTLQTQGLRSELTHEAVHVLQHMNVIDILVAKGMSYAEAVRQAANILNWQLKVDTDYRFAHEAVSYWLQCRITAQNFSWGPCRDWSRYKKNQDIYEQPFPDSGRKHRDWVGFVTDWYETQYCIAHGCK
jgi:hypothetical protein